MNADSRALTTSDRLTLTGFSVFILLSMAVGAVTALYVQVTYLGGWVTRGSTQWAELARYLGGMLGGTAVGLVLTRFFTHRFISLQTQKRWLETLKEMLENPYVQRRGPGFVRLFMWAVVPDRNAL